MHSTRVERLPTRGDGSLDYGNLQVRARLPKHVGGTKTAGAGAHDDNVALGIGVKILEVTTGHGTGDLALTDWVEGEGLPLVGHVL